MTKTILNGIPTQPAARPITLARLMAESLEGLLADANVRFVESSITDRDFYGAAVLRNNGQPVLLMPANRTELERDTITRYLLAQALGLDVSQLPKPFDVAVRPLEVTA